MNSIPNFEGHPVIATAIKMSGATPMDELSDVVIGVDDLVQMISQFRCVGIQHQVNPKTGELIRVQVLRPVEMVLLPIVEGQDNGIARALPTPINGHDSVTVVEDDE